MKIGIIGGGVVGRATARVFMEHADVMVWDILPERRTFNLSIGEMIEGADLTFICLPTPQRPNSLECDTTALDGFFFECSLPRAKKWRTANLVIRSTVPVGFTSEMREKYDIPNLVHSPEFLTARCAMADAQCPARNIIGDMGYGAGMPDICDASRALNGLYLQRFPGIRVHLMTSDESETVKLALNSFFALKVSFFNEVYSLCQKMGMDFEVVRAGMLSDGRIAHSHTQVPGPDGKRGFGGTCLPKDLASLIYTFWQEKVEGGAKVMLAALERNQLDRREDHHGQGDPGRGADSCSEAR